MNAPLWFKIFVALLLVLAPILFYLVISYFNKKMTKAERIRLTIGITLEFILLLACLLALAAFVDITASLQKKGKNYENIFNIFFDNDYCGCFAAS